MITGAQVEAALAAAMDAGQYIVISPDAMRAALAAAQAAAPGIMDVLKREYAEGFAAGIEAAAQREIDDAQKHLVGSAWTDDRGITLQQRTYPGDGFKPANGPAIAYVAALKRAAAIRALRPDAAPARAPSEDNEHVCPTCGEKHWP